MNPTFKYCAVRYLDVWLRKESTLVEGLKSPTPDSIRAGLAHFKVSRGFAGIDDPKVGCKVAQLLLRHDRYVTPKTAPSRVIDFARELESDLGYDNLLSAAS